MWEISVTGATSFVAEAVKRAVGIEAVEWEGFGLVRLNTDCFDFHHCFSSVDLVCCHY